MGPKQCQVCNEAQSKYKCPSCLLPYCSLSCFKKHKEIPCVKPVSSKENSVAIPCVNPVSSKENSVASDTEIPCVKPSTKDKLTTGVESYRERPYYVDEPSQMLENFQLESIVSSSEIRDALKDEDLQKLIYNIDCSPEAENELEKAMGNEVFLMFTAKILSAIVPGEQS